MIQHPQSNYYQSPIINNPPVPSMPNTYSPYYQQYYQQYYNNYYPQNYPQYNAPCVQYPQMTYQAYNNYGNYGGKCHCVDCGQYGLSINRERLTPKFPEKLPYSFVTSGDRVEDKLVINEPTHESAPFQTQRRKTYVPYTRKYIEYQDYVQYIPVQRSEWQYQKVMKQIDYVPQEYYESSIEYIPQEKVEHKLQYLPVEQQVVHVPEEKLQPRPQLNISNVSKRYVTGAAFPPLPVRNTTVTQIRNTNVLPVRNSVVSMEGQPQIVIPGNMNTQTYRRVIVDPNQQILANDGNQIRNVQRFTSSIRPAESSVEMVPRSRLNPMDETAKNTITKETNQNSYQFPQSGGVIIGTSIPQMEQRQGNVENYSHEYNQNEVNRVQDSEVLASVLNNLPEQAEQNHNFDFRESGKVFSEEFNIDPRHYEKKESIVNRFEEDDNL